MKGGLEMMDNGVTVLNFDDTYYAHKYLQKPFYEWLDLSDIRSTNGYCERVAFFKIRQRLKKRKNKRITLIGSGNYHYVSYLFLSEIKEPFSLVLFDYHTDMLDVQCHGVLSCGSWVLEALRNNPMLQKVLIIGVNQEYIKLIPQSFQDRVLVITDSMIEQGDYSLESVLAELTDKVYISIDKDVLDCKDAFTNWEQGTMTLEELTRNITYVAKTKKISGVDICGEYSCSLADIYLPKSREANKKNERANKLLIKAVREFNFGKQKKHRVS